MKTLNTYVTKSFLVTFFMAIGILTFGMTGARIIRVLDVISQGIPVSVFFQFVAYMMPTVLTFTVPWAIMAAVMLVFGRLSADSEITAMRACGISILQITAPILLITFLVTLLCLYLQIEVGPPGLGKSRELMRNAAINQPMAIFEPGKPVNYANTIIYVDDKVGDRELRGVQLYTLDSSSASGIAQDVFAARGELEVDTEKQILTVVLYDCLIVDKKSKPEVRSSAKEMRYPFQYGKSVNAAPLFIRPKYMTLKELVARIRITKMLPVRNPELETQLEVQLNRRIAFALSPIAFLLLGMPLAIRTSRRETSVGLFISVILAGLFFILIIFCDSLTSFPKLYPQYLLWLPNIVFQLLGAYMTYRISQR